MTATKQHRLRPFTEHNQHGERLAYSLMER